MFLFHPKKPEVSRSEQMCLCFKDVRSIQVENEGKKGKEKVEKREFNILCTCVSLGPGCVLRVSNEGKSEVRRNFTNT